MVGSSVGGNGNNGMVSNQFRIKESNESMIGFEVSLTVANVGNGSDDGGQ